MKQLEQLLEAAKVLNAEVAKVVTAIGTTGDVVSLMQTQVLLGDIEDEVASAKTAITKAYDFFRLNVLPQALEEQGVSTLTAAGVGRVSLVADAYVSVPAAGVSEFHTWLRDTGSEALIKETVHAGTLKAFVKGLIKEGKEFPADLIKVTPFTRAQITKQ